MEMAVVLGLVKGSKRKNVVGLRLVDFPASAPTLRLWNDERFGPIRTSGFDFSGNGDAGAGTGPTRRATFCVRYHVDYYKANWHSDCLWEPRMAHEQLADLLTNILGGGATTDG